MADINYKEAHKDTLKWANELNKQCGRYQRDRAKALKFLNDLTLNGKLSDLTKAQTKKYNSIILRLQKP